jgi:hypothetical protein
MYQGMVNEPWANGARRPQQSKELKDHNLTPIKPSFCSFSGNWYHYQQPFGSHFLPFEREQIISNEALPKVFAVTI